MIERERTFLVARLPAQLPTAREICQGYLAVEDATSVRIRRAGDERTLTIKAGAGMERTEVELALDAEQWQALSELVGERHVEKQRYQIDVDGLTAELDIFSGELDGLCLVEVEFATREQAVSFAPPDWFGAEVTDDARYTNAWMAGHGRPS